MKFPSLFTKTPSYKRFGYTPRFYDPKEEERRAREERIRSELKLENKTEEGVYRSRIAGSFKEARRLSSRQSDPSASLLRIIILTFLTIWLIAFLQFGTVTFYALLLFIPFYLYLKFKRR
jgi:hypothetical protein